MKRAIPLALVILAGLSGYAQAQITRELFQMGCPVALLAVMNSKDARGAPVMFHEGQRVALVGKISSAPKHVAGIHEERKMQVAIGPSKVDYTLHLGEARLVDASGRKIETDDLVDKMWVRAEGTVMNDPRRIKVSRLHVVGKDLPSFQRSAFFRPSFNQGYIVAVAGSREVFPEKRGPSFSPAPMVIVGKVSDDTGPLETTRKIQVDAAGHTWTLHVPGDAPVLDEKGEKISVHEIAKGQWLRAHGWQTDDLRMRVARIQTLGPEEAFRTSAHYRAAAASGYAERVPGTGVRFQPIKVTGVITQINEREGSVTLRDDHGVDRTLSTETVTIHANGRPVGVGALRQGQRVTIRGSEIRF